MQIASNKIFGYLEAVMLLLVGGLGLCLSFTDNYLLLMNEKFRWLTFTGSALIFILGAVSVLKPGKRSMGNSIFFLVLVLLTIFGQPFLPGKNHIDPTQEFMQAGLWDQIDQERFPKMELRNLSTLEADKVYESGSSFTTVGVVKRLNELDDHSSFALMSTFMYCCVADMFGTGFRVPTEELGNMEEGQMVMISGKLIPEEQLIELPNFRFGMAMISSTNKDYYLLPEQIMSYNRLNQLPLLPKLLGDGEKTQRFTNALKETGLLKELEKQGPFTLFVPVDKALENMPTPWQDMSPRKQKRFLQKHIVKGKHFSKDLKNDTTLKSLNRKNLEIKFNNGSLSVNQSRVLFKDNEAQNGVIHFIYPALGQAEENQ